MFRQIHVSIWAEPWFIPLSPYAKLLFLALIAHPLTDLAGFSSASLPRLASDTAIPLPKVQPALAELIATGRVQYFPILDLIWLTRLHKWQGGGPKYKVALERAIGLLPLEAQKAFVSLYPNTVSDTVSHRVSDTVCHTVADTGIQNPSDPINISRNINISRSRSNPPLPPPGAAITTTITSKDTDRYGDTHFAAITQSYEAEIGMLTPTIGEELKSLLADSPNGQSPEEWSGWIVKAIKHAAGRNARNLHYIQATLKGWQAQGWQMKPKPKGGPDGKRQTDIGPQPGDLSALIRRGKKHLEEQARVKGSRGDNQVPPLPGHGDDISPHPG